MANARAAGRAKKLREAFAKRLRFYAIVLGTIVVVLLIGLRLSIDLYWIDPNSALRAIVVRTLEALVSAAITSACLAYFATIIKPEIGDPLESAPIPATSIDNILKAGAHASKSWEYVGHTGRYTRSTIVPILRERAENENAPLRVRFVVLDPHSNEAIENYSRYRMQARTGSGAGAQTWSTDQIRRELLATILSVAELYSLDMKFYVEIGLVQFVNVLRFDAGEDFILVTEEDPRRPAYRYDSDHTSYELYARMMNLTWIQSRKVTLPRFDRFIPTLGMTKDEALSVSKALDVATPGNKLSDDDVDAALELYRIRKNPYAA